MLEIKGLTVSYNRRPGDGPVLRGVSMTLDGEKAVIVGPNGSGKSTLFRAILGLLPIQSGEVEVFGKDVQSETNDVRVSTNLADVYRLACVPGRNIVRIFAELKGEDPQVALRLFHDFELDEVLRKKVHEVMGPGIGVEADHIDWGFGT